MVKFFGQVEVHCSSKNNLKVDSDILALLHVIESLENLWLFAVGFMEISLPVFKL